MGGAGGVGEGVGTREYTSDSLVLSGTSVVSFQDGSNTWEKKNLFCCLVVVVVVVVFNF